VAGAGTVGGPVGAALVGYGYWGANLARNIDAAAGLRLVGVCESGPGPLREAGAAHPGTRLWSTFDEVLADDEVEAVVIATPAHLHEDLTAQVLDAGLHVLVEKPLAMSAEAAERLVAHQDSLGPDGPVLMVGHTFLYSPPVIQLRDYIRKGELGRIEYLYSQRLSLGRIRRDCNALWNFAPHDVAIMLYLLEERPVEVSGTAAAMINPDVADVFFASLRFASGITSHLHVSWIDPRKTRLMTIVGDEKMAIYDDVAPDQKVTIVDAGVAREDGLGAFRSMGEFQWQTRAGDIYIPRIPMTEPLRNEMEAFAAAILTGEQPVADARHGADVVAVLAAIDESARRGGAPVGLDW
jgi:predicted dehydrogenase